LSRKLEYKLEKKQENKMPRNWNEKYKTVAIQMEVYEMLSKIAEDEGRSKTMQISWIIKKYAEKKNT
tara:strand:+ start:129 stop:329 length:201 start_codon:yes stop_codon:yes gene_type:complete